MSLPAPVSAQYRCPDGTYWRSGRCRSEEPYPYNRSEVYRERLCLGPYNYCAAVCRQGYVTSGSSAFRACMDQCAERYAACETAPPELGAQ